MMGMAAMLMKTAVVYILTSGLKRGQALKYPLPGFVCRQRAESLTNIIV